MRTGVARIHEDQEGRTRRERNRRAGRRHLTEIAPRLNGTGTHVKADVVSLTSSRKSFRRGSGLSLPVVPLQSSLANANEMASSAVLRVVSG